MEICNALVAVVVRVTRAPYCFICSQLQCVFTSADKNECATPETNQCNANSLCTNTEGSYVCRCLNGYQGDGLQCQGIF